MYVTEGMSGKEKLNLITGLEHQKTGSWMNRISNNHQPPSNCPNFISHVIKIYPTTHIAKRTQESHQTRSQLSISSLEDVPYTKWNVCGGFSYSVEYSFSQKVMKWNSLPSPLYPTPYLTTLPDWAGEVLYSIWILQEKLEWRGNEWNLFEKRNELKMTIPKALRAIFKIIKVTGIS